MGDPPAKRSVPQLHCRPLRERGAQEPCPQVKRSSQEEHLIVANTATVEPRVGMCPPNLRDLTFYGVREVFGADPGSLWRAVPHYSYRLAAP